MLSFDIRSNGALVRAQLTDLQRKHLPKAEVAAADRAGRYVYAALRSEMEQVFDRPTPWALNGLRYRPPSSGRPLVSIWLEDFGGKSGIPASKFLAAEIEGGQRKHKRFEKALIFAGLMPASHYAVPGDQLPLDAYGNVSSGFIVRVLSDLRAFGEQGYRRNRRGARKGARRTNYFFAVPDPRSRVNNSHLRPGIYWHLPNGLLTRVFVYVRRTQYARRLDFFGVGERAYTRVAGRFMTEELAKLVRLDNR